MRGGTRAGGINGAELARAVMAGGRRSAGSAGAGCDCVVVSGPGTLRRTGTGTARNGDVCCCG